MRKQTIRQVIRAALVASGLFAQGMPSNAADSPNRSATTTEIIQLEQTMWDHWKARRIDAMRDLMTADAVMVVAGGILGRDKQVDIMKQQQCSVASVSLSNVKVTALGADAMLITYSPKPSGTCDGQKLDDGQSVHSSAWAKRSGKWLTVFHQETAVTSAARK